MITFSPAKRTSSVIDVPDGRLDDPLRCHRRPPLRTEARRTGSAVINPADRVVPFSELIVASEVWIAPFEGTVVHDADWARVDRRSARSVAERIGDDQSPSRAVGRTSVEDGERIGDVRRVIRSSPDLVRHLPVRPARAARLRPPARRSLAPACRSRAARSRSRGDERVRGRSHKRVTRVHAVKEPLTPPLPPPARSRSPPAARAPARSASPRA